jgi:hypothetical protein
MTELGQKLPPISAGVLVRFTLKIGPRRGQVRFPNTCSVCSVYGQSFQILASEKPGRAWAVWGEGPGGTH